MTHVFYSGREGKPVVLILGCLSKLCFTNNASKAWNNSPVTFPAMYTKGYHSLFITQWADSQFPA